MTTLLASALLASAAPAATPTYAYVSIAGESKIAIYRVDAQSGKLQKSGETAVDGAPGSLTTDSRRRFLFVALRGTGKLASFRIDPATGGLTQISIVSVNTDPSYVGLDRSERYLLSAYYAAGKVMVHPLAPDGTISATPSADVVTEKTAHSAIPTSSNRFVFVPHVVPNAVFQFAFDATTGRLSPNAVPRAAAPAGAGPRHLKFDPAGKFVYTSNESGSSVSLYQVDADSGTLSVKQTLSTLPAGFQGENTCAEVKVHPSGKFVYVSNRGHESIAVFSVDPTTGMLTARGQTPTEKEPRSFDLDPDGRYLYAAGEGGTRAAAYRVDPQTGALTPIEGYEVGKRPFWILIVPMPAKP
jgi:6-phosphogluconolactonase